MSVKHWAWAGLFALGACSGNAVKVTPRSFDRPGDVAFACFEDATALPVPLERCDIAVADTNFTLHAIVTQTARGEVAAVDLRDETVLDSDRRVPGYTFVRVGEIPVAVVVPSVDPRYTYIASFGSQRIDVVPTAILRPDSPAVPERQTAVELGAPPTALLLSPDERSLFVALPDLGEVVRFPIAEDGMLGEPDRLTFGSDVPDPEPAPEDVPVYRKTCPPGNALLDVPGGYVPREPVTIEDAPRPSALAMDAESGRLLVGDANLPLVHVIDLESLTEEDPIVTSVPTTDIALTPEVPLTVGESSDVGRYLYAIDATDGSVLVVDYFARAVIPVDAQGFRAVDRISFSAGADSLEILTPDANGNDCALETIGAASAAPTRLRGVFLAAGLTDGTVRIVDVLDRDATCRGGDAECNGGTDDDFVMYLSRHHPRIGAFVRSFIGVTGTPTLVANGVTYRLGPDGTTTDPLAPDLGVLDECPEPLVQAYPEPQAGGPVLCTLGDPWAAAEEQWVAAWEGTIPGASGGRGRFDPVENVFTGEAAFCARGVLGRENAPEEGPEAAITGDLLIITSPLPPTTADDEECAAFLTTDAMPRDTLDFPIRRSFGDHLEIADETRGGVSLDDIRRCFPELVEYDVWVGGAYAVTSSRNGLLHRVVGSGDEACEVDASAPPRIGRANTGELFSNGIVAFEIAATQDDNGFTPGRGDIVQLLFAIGQVPSKLSLDAGVLPSTIRYIDTSRQLFAIDSSSQGLVQVSLSDFTILQSYQ